MSKNAFNKKYYLGLLLAIALSACKSTPIAEQQVTEDKRTDAISAPDSTGADNTGADTAAISSESTSVNPLTDPNNILSKRSIYFDFDKDSIPEEYRELLNAHAEYLSANNNAKATLQGNADERGTREYNLSLGQRRAVAVKKSLNLNGVQDRQIETISYGEEKAVPDCKDEACHQQNRRVDVVYDGE